MQHEFDTRCQHRKWSVVNKFDSWALCSLVFLQSKPTEMPGLQMKGCNLFQ